MFLESRWGESIFSQTSENAKKTTHRKEKKIHVTSFCRHSHLLSCVVLPRTHQTHVVLCHRGSNGSGQVGRGRRHWRVQPRSSNNCSKGAETLRSVPYSHVYVTHTVTHCIPIPTLPGGYYYEPHCRDEEAEACNLLTALRRISGRAGSQTQSPAWASILLASMLC